VHLDRLRGGAPDRWRWRPSRRKFSPTQFLEWAQKQTALAQQVYSCYEAGPFGYCLHRQLRSWALPLRDPAPGLGRVWQEVKTDKRDAKAMVLESGPVCLRQHGSVLCRARATESFKSKPGALAPAGELAEGEAASGGPGTAATPLFTRAFWKRLVDRRSPGRSWWCRPLCWSAEPLRRLIQALEQELKTLSQALDRRRPGATGPRVWVN